MSVASVVPTSRTGSTGKIVSAREAVRLIRPGDTVAIGGFFYTGLALEVVHELAAVFEAADEGAVVHYGREFFRTHRVSRGAFQTALEQFGRQGVVELGLIMGNYSLLALLINSFDTDLPPDRTEPLLPV